MTATETGDEAQAGDWKTGVADWFQFMRTVLLNAVIILALAAIIAFTVKDLWRESVIIEEFGLPPVLEQRGLSGAVTAHRVWDAMTEVQDRAGTKKQTRSLLAESRALDVVQPGTGISMRSLTQLLRDLFGWQQTRIAGEVICTTATCDWDGLSLRLRVFYDGRMRILNSGPVAGRDPDRVFLELALRALEIFDPYVVAAYHFAEGAQHEEAERLALYLVDTGHLQAAWAANLLGNNAQLRGDHAAAMAWFDRAEELARRYGEKRFALPHYGRGNSLIANEDYQAAMAAFDLALKTDAGFSLAHHGRGMVLMLNEDYPAAMTAFREAARLNPGNAAHMHGMGAVAAALGDRQSALRHLQRAIRLDAEYAPAQALLGSLLLMERQNGAQAMDHLSAAATADPALIHSLQDIKAASLFGNSLARVQVAVSELRRAEAAKLLADAKNLAPKLVRADTGSAGAADGEGRKSPFTSWLRISN